MCRAWNRGMIFPNKASLFTRIRLSSLLLYFHFLHWIYSSKCQLCTDQVHNCTIALFALHLSALFKFPNAASLFTWNHLSSVVLYPLLALHLVKCGLIWGTVVLHQLLALDLSALWSSKCQFCTDLERCFALFALALSALCWSKCQVCTDLVHCCVISTCCTVFECNVEILCSSNCQLCADRGQCYVMTTCCNGFECTVEILCSSKCQVCTYLVHCCDNHTLVCHDVSSSVVSTWLQHVCATPCGFKSTVPDLRVAQRCQCCVFEKVFYSSFVLIRCIDVYVI